MEGVEIKQDWHGKVYHPNDDPFPEDWHEIVSQAKQRDHYRCRECRTSKELTVHHIKPRSEGGTNNLSNLITLCRRCHDLIELGDDIVKKVENQKIQIIDSNDWHIWVYGGGKNPVNNLSPKT